MVNLYVHLIGKNDNGQDCILSAHEISYEALDLMVKNKKIHDDMKLYQITDSFIATNDQQPTLLFVEEIK